MVTANESIIVKIQAAPNLAANPGTPEEGEAAAAVVQRLLTRYNLDMADVQAAEGRVVEEYTWQKEFGRGVAEAILARLVNQQKETSQTMALVVQSEGELDDAMRRLLGPVKNGTPSRERQASQTARNVGFMTGMGMALAQDKQLS